MSADHSTAATLEMASVVFMDIVGFSRNPVETQLDILQRLQNIVRATPAYGAADATGQLLKLPTGDGMALVFFRDPLGSIHCAVQTQLALRRQPNLLLRIGIHSGPIYRHSDILENANVVGGGINIAQRVMDCGDAGHILLSRQMAEVLAQTGEWSRCLHDLGTTAVKHGVELHLFNLVRDEAGNSGRPSRISAARPQELESVSAAETPSIAVLPFANMSGDKEQEYFSDGLAEEILNLLAKIPGLRVIARTSAYAFKGQNTDIRRIAETLGVSNILEGSVRRAANRIRVTAQLIEAKNGSHLWSERYDRELTDVFAVQDEIGAAISEALKVRLAPRTHVVNLDAWQHCLKGEYHRQRNTPESAENSIEHYERAVAADPDYAQAWSGLALSYFVVGAMGTRPVNEMRDLARVAAEKALAVDPSHSEAHIVLALVAGVFDYDWKRAEIHHRSSLAGESVHPRAPFCYAYNFLVPAGRAREAVEQCRVSLAYDPLHLIYHDGLIWCLYCAGEYREAIDSGHRALEINPNFHLIMLGTGLAQLTAGQPDDAIRTLSRIVELAPWFTSGAGCLAAAYYCAGEHERAKDLARQSGPARNLSFGHAMYYAIAGEADAMFEALDRAFERREVYLPRIQYVPFFDPYHADPRFTALLQRMNLVE